MRSEEGARERWGDGAMGQGSDGAMGQGSDGVSELNPERSRKVRLKKLHTEIRLNGFMLKNVNFAIF